MEQYDKDEPARERIMGEIISSLRIIIADDEESRQLQMHFFNFMRDKVNLLKLFPRLGTAAVDSLIDSLLTICNTNPSPPAAEAMMLLTSLLLEGQSRRGQHAHIVLYLRRTSLRPLPADQGHFNEDVPASLHRRLRLGPYCLFPSRQFTWYARYFPLDRNLRRQALGFVLHLLATVPQVAPWPGLPSSCGGSRRGRGGGGGRRRRKPHEDITAHCTQAHPSSCPRSRNPERKRVGVKVERNLAQ